MNAGELRHRVAIQTPSDTQDSTGQAIESWTDIANAWAAIEPLRGRELFVAQQVNAQTTTRIRMRYVPGLELAVDATMRVSFTDPRTGLTTNYNINAVIDVDLRHIELNLLCSSGVAALVIHT